MDTVYVDIKKRILRIGQCTVLLRPAGSCRMWTSSVPRNLRTWKKYHSILLVWKYEQEFGWNGLRIRRRNAKKQLVDLLCALLMCHVCWFVLTCVILCSCLMFLFFCCSRNACSLIACFSFSCLIDKWCGQMILSGFWSMAASSPIFEEYGCRNHVVLFYSLLQICILERIRAL